MLGRTAPAAAQHTRREAVKGSDGGGAYVAVARILRPRGRVGEVVAEVLTDFPERFNELRRVLLERCGGSPEAAELAQAWWHESQLILRFSGIDSISKADELRGRLVLVPSEQRVALGEHRYYLSDVVGCTVLDRSGSPLGQVVAVEPTGGVDLLHVRRSAESDPGRAREELLIPFAQEICSEIDVQSRRIVIDPPEGLLDLND